MTREEAIELNKNLMMYMRISDKTSEYKFLTENYTALEMAIKALEQEPCDDTVSREGAKSFLYERLNRLNNDELYDIFSIIIDDMYNELPSVQPKSRWIPVSERLPEREGWYLTSLGDKTYGGADVDMYCKGWVKYGTHVLAWMPLPEPYEPSN